MNYSREYDEDGFVWIESAYQAQSITLTGDQDEGLDFVESVTINEAW